MTSLYYDAGVHQRRPYAVQSNAIAASQPAGFIDYRGGLSSMSADNQFVRYQSPAPIYGSAAVGSPVRQLITGPWLTGDDRVVARRDAPLRGTPSVNLVTSHSASGYHKYVTSDPATGQPVTFIEMDGPSDVVDDHREDRSYHGNNNSSWSGRWRQSRDPYLVRSGGPPVIHNQTAPVSYIQSIPQEVMVARGQTVPTYSAVRSNPVDTSRVMHYGYQSRVTSGAPYSYQSRETVTGNPHGYSGL